MTYRHLRKYPDPRKVVLRACANSDKVFIVPREESGYVATLYGGFVSSIPSDRTRVV